MAKKVFLAFAPGTGDPRAPGQAERVVFVREGFHLLAFAFTLPWLLVKRAWFGALVYVVAVAAVQVVLVVAGASPTTSLGVTTVLSLLFGLEASALLQTSLRYRGFIHVASIVADTANEAELKFFREYTPPAPRAPIDRSVLGLFPGVGPNA
jgi:thiol:disulfide interchange protein